MTTPPGEVEASAGKGAPPAEVSSPAEPGITQFRQALQGASFETEERQAMSPRKRVRVVVSGLVQGVFFRDSTRRRAESLGVTGWVRNNPDGTVEAVFEGNATQVGALVQWCRRGPPGAEVEDVSVVEEPYRGESDRFAIRYG